VLFFFVATLVPYQFAYMVACLVQLVVCVKALRTAKESVSVADQTARNSMMLTSFLTGPWDAIKTILGFC